MSYQPGGLVLPDLSRRGYLSKNASSSNRFGLVNGDGLSKDSLLVYFFALALKHG